MILNPNDTVRDARLVLLKSLLEASGNGYLRILDGTMPTDTSGAVTTTLVEFTLGNPIGTLASHTLTFNLPDIAVVSNAGTATWCRLYSASGVALLDGDCGLAASSAFCKMSAVALGAGAYVSVTSLALSN